MWPILWILHLSRNMKHWNCSAVYRYSHCIHRLHATMRPNIILRSNSHYHPSLSNPPMLILSASSRSTNTNMNWRTTCRTPLHCYRTMSVYFILSPNPSTNASN
eukprot:bmy_12979T0